MKKAVVIFSGGQDSTTCLYWAKQNFDYVEAMTFFYGQKHSIEMYCAQTICSKEKIRQTVIDISFLNGIVESALTSDKLNINEVNKKGLPASFVPNRNALFITLAHAYAQKIGADNLVTGVCETDYSGYPDCRQMFIDAINKSTMKKLADLKAKLAEISAAIAALGAAQAAGENMPYSMENFMPPIPPELQADLAQRMAKTPMTPENIAQVQAPAAIEEIKRIREENQIRPGTVGSVATDVASSVAQFGPIAAASLIAPTVAPAGLAFLATVSGGQQYNKARNAGFTEEQALAQGVAFGAAEAIGEKIGLDYLMKSLSNPALMSGIKGILKAAVKNAGVEGGEEMLTQGLQNATEIIAKKINPQTKGEAPTLLQDVPYAGFVGGLSGAGMGAIGAAIQNYANPPKQEAPPQPEQEQTPPEQPAQESPTATEPPPQKMEQTTEELAVPPEPAPTVIQQPREADARLERVQPEFQQEPRPEMRPQPIDQLFRRERTITQPEAATTPVSEPEGIKPQTVETTSIKTPETVTNSRGEKYIVFRHTPIFG